jgi:hypothetical protein
MEDVDLVGIREAARKAIERVTATTDGFALVLNEHDPAEPATSTSAPAAVTSGAVSAVTPPSISMSIGRAPIIAFTRFTLSTIAG